MAKAAAIRHVCRQCGHETPKWLGKCPGCSEWGTLEETITAPARTPSPIASRTINGYVTRNQPTLLAQVPSPSEEGRIKTNISEFDRVLGGGIVRGSVVLLGGDPGIGKSTLLTQVAGSLAGQGGKVLYVSGEESTTQIKLRAERLGINSGDILLFNEVDATLIGAHLEAERPTAAIIDSIQTMQHPESDSAAGSVTQVRSCTSALSSVAKMLGIPIFLVGHVNKEGALAGPRVLEHMVDTVLTFEGDRHYSYRIIRAAKNRFGSTDEIALFEMREEGLVEVTNPSELLLAERKEHATGSAVGAIVEGSRPLLIEVQGLVTPSYLASPRRTFSGVDNNRVNLILAVLEKRAGLALGSRDVFVNVAGGVRVDEPAADLAIAISVASNFYERPVDPSTIIIGEVGLGGEVRGVSNVEKRLREAARMGFKRALVSPRNHALAKKVGGIAVVGVEDVRVAMDRALVDSK